jgi:hypothetical protein
MGRIILGMLLCFWGLVAFISPEGFGDPSARWFPLIVLGIPGLLFIYFGWRSRKRRKQFPTNRFVCACGKNLGTKWHYRFESWQLGSTVGAQCPNCGRIVCKNCLNFGSDGNYPPCPNCGIPLQVMSEGPAYSSMVEGARYERRYRGAIKDPSELGRPVIRESGSAANRA